jgi:flavin-dependent dehydrogenase
LLERSHYPAGRVGETLSPEAVRWLAWLGLLDTVWTIRPVPSPGVVAVWDTGDLVETDFIFAARGPGWHVDRARFNAVLADAAAAAGVQVVRGARTRDCLPSGIGWGVTADLKGQRVEFTTRWVLDATGRSSWLARRLGLRPALTDRLVGIVAWFDDLSGDDQRLYLEAVPGGWWYFAPLQQGRGVAVFLTDASLLAPRGAAGTWEFGLTGSQLIRERLSGRRPTTVRQVAAGTRWAGTVAGPGWLAIGDAALAHDPLSGSGICQALAAGWNAVEVVVAADAGNAKVVAEYQKAADEEFRRYAREWRAMYGRIMRWPSDPFWGRRMAAHDDSQ